jgi:hypothetical protein
MVSEFIRFQLTKSNRIITGVLQLIAVVGLIIAFEEPLIGFIASSGLALLMLLGFTVRLRIKDGIYKASSSLIYMVLNIILAYHYYLVTF